MSNHSSDNAKPSPSAIHEETCETPEEELRLKLLFKALRGDWVSFVEDYEKKPELKKSVLTQSKQNALHIAIAAGDEKIAMKLIPSHEDKITMMDENADTALHQAAAMGMKKLCEKIVSQTPIFHASNGETPIFLAGNNKKEEEMTPIFLARNKNGEAPIIAPNKTGETPIFLTRNKNGETPIFLAASYGWKEIFLYFHWKVPHSIGADKDFDYCQRWDGNTMLHCAIANDKFDVAFTVLKLYPHLITSCNNNGDTPLHILATKPKAFRSGTEFGILDRLIYSYYDEWLAKLMKRCNKSLPGDKDVEIEGPKNMEQKRKLVKIIMDKLIKNAGSWSTYYFNEECLGKINSDEERTMLWAPPNLHISDSSNSKKMVKATKRRSKKEEISDSSKKIEKEFGETPFLIAARNGVIEMVEAILENFPEAINDRRACDGKNALLLAIENRQIKVYDFLIKFMEMDKKKIPRKDVCKFQDRKRNNTLHLAAICSDHVPSLMPGGAMKMLWEMKWYEYVKNSFPFSFTEARNADGKTPSEVFEDTHKDLIKKVVDGGKWVNKSSQSCSLIAVLVATVAFASATTFPGGNNEQGLPIFRGNVAFKVYMILSIFALCSSLTSLVMFLAVIISPYLDARGFNKRLLQKLVLGLVLLLLSIVAMSISFVAAHFLFRTNRKLPIHQFAWFYMCYYLPFIIIVIWQFPFYPDLVLSVFVAKPQPWYK